MSTRRFFLLLLIMPLLVCCCSLFASNLDEVVMNNVFSTYKVGSYLFVARYGGDFNNTTPVYVGDMTVSENQTLDISGYWDSVGSVPVVVAQTVKVYLNPRTNEPYNYPYPFTSVTSPHITLNGNTADTPLPAVPNPYYAAMYGAVTGNRSIGTVSAAKLAPHNSTVSLSSVVVTLLLTDSYNNITAFYVQEPYAGGCGIRVIRNSGDFPDGAVEVGKMITSISGTLDANGPEPCLMVSGLPAMGSKTVSPVGMAGKATIGKEYGRQKALCYDPTVSPVVTGNNVNRVGTLVKVWGKITDFGDDCFYIDDGSGLVATDGTPGLKVSSQGVTSPPHQVGDFIAVIGVLGVDPASHTSPADDIITPILYMREDLRVYANRIYVDITDGDDDNNGLTWATAKATIKNAVNAVTPGGEVWVKAGNYALPAKFEIYKPVRLYGGFSGTETALNQRNWATNATNLLLQIGGTSSPDSGIGLLAKKPITISGFKISVFDFSIYTSYSNLMLCSSCDISHNEIYGCNSISISLEESEENEDVKIYDNYIQYSKCGIGVSTTANELSAVTVENNTLVGYGVTEPVGIDLKTSLGNNADTVCVINNIIKGGEIGIKKLPSSPVPVLSSNCIDVAYPDCPPEYTPEQVEMEANHNRYAGFVFGSGDNPMYLDLSRIHPIHENPNLVGNFLLGNGSPCINAGSGPTIARTEDLVHNNRINSIIDVGCCESLPVEEE